MSKGNDQEGRLVLWYRKGVLGTVVFNRNLLPQVDVVGTLVVFIEPQLKSALPLYSSLTLGKGKIRLLMEMIAVRDKKFFKNK